MELPCQADKVPRAMVTPWPWGQSPLQPPLGLSHKTHSELQRDGSSIHPHVCFPSKSSPKEGEQLYFGLLLAG